MYLERLHIKGFRSFSDGEVVLRPGVTVLLGENNAGKSNAMDAVRLLTLPLDGRKDRYFEREDLHRDGCGATHRPDCRTSIELSAYYAGESGNELALFDQALNADGRTISHHVAYTPPSAGRNTGRTVWRAGDTATADADPEPQSRGRIRHVYLPPLRDAQRELASGRNTRLQQVVEQVIADEEERKLLIGGVGERLAEFEDKPPLNGVVDAIGRNLGPLTEAASRQAAGIGFAEPTLTSIARSLRLRIEEEGLDVRDLASTGLGYANLLFMATVLTQLESADEADLTLLLVEEPEAHLHPQLQNSLMAFLQEKAEESRAPQNRGDFLGHVQVVVTTHSPHIATAVAPEDLVVLHRAPVEARPDLGVDTAAALGEGDAPAERAAAPDHRTAAVPVAKLGLAKREAEKIGRYLDARRNTMLFGPRVLLVEGISDALLISHLAERTLRGPAWRRYKGTALVPIDGTDFVPYLKILLNPAPETGMRIARRVAVVTDGDGTRKRAGDLTAMIAGCGAGAVARVFTSATTLEPEVLQADSRNADLFWKAWELQRPRAFRKDMDRVLAAAPAERAEAVKKTVSHADLNKGDFMQDLCALSAERIERGEDGLTVPEYLHDALAWIVEEGERDDSGR
ncbi:ATP-dependent nuclease [Nocardiopsis baichengensis]|uniref:ATP-dependent nuclease n=1 Tax=Nocardiopsis baichengensis TaxID=280240 RepID=UPI000345C9AF|nr:AAA family ATPase [Nocardiopsis baichengensis]